MKQTAIIWLQQAMKSTLSHEQIMAVEGLYQQALAMEKEQIVNAYDAGLFDGTMDNVNDRLYKNAEQYYNETYNK